MWGPQNVRVKDVDMADFKPDPNCKECKGTGVYVGLWLDVGPCRACQATHARRARGEEEEEEAPLHRCARAARAITPTRIPEAQPDVQLNVDLKETWKKLFQPPQSTP